MTSHGSSPSGTGVGLCESDSKEPSVRHWELQKPESRTARPESLLKESMTKEEILNTIFAISLVILVVIVVYTELKEGTGPE